MEEVVVWSHQMVMVGVLEWSHQLAMEEVLELHLSVQFGAMEEVEVQLLVVDIVDVVVAVDTVVVVDTVVADTAADTAVDDLLVLKVEPVELLLKTVKEEEVELHHHDAKEAQVVEPCLEQLIPQLPL